MVSMSGCNATAVADILALSMDDTKVELRIRIVDQPNIVSEFEPHPKQASGGILASTSCCLYCLYVLPKAHSPGNGPYVHTDNMNMKCWLHLVHEPFAVLLPHT